MVKVSPRTKKTNFEVDFSDAESVVVVGDFNGWDENSHPMKKNKKGIWKLALEIPAGEYQFRYLVNQHDWRNDADVTVVPNDFGSMNSLIEVSFPKPRSKKKKNASKKAATADKHTS